MTTEEMQTKLDALLEQIKQTFPMHSNSIGVHLAPSGKGLQITFYDSPSYAQATDSLRDCGIGTRKKTIIREWSPDAFVSLNGNVGVHNIHIFSGELPPSCRKVTYVEKIPKEQTVDTGEFVGVERTKVVCR